MNPKTKITRLEPKPKAPKPQPEYRVVSTVVRGNKTNAILRLLELPPIDRAA